MFDAKKETERIEEFIRDYFKKYNLKGVVLGISGGKDSAIVAGLFTRALGKENVLGVTLPCHSQKTDKNDAKVVADHFGFELQNIDLTPVFDDFVDQIHKIGNFTEDELKNSNINLKPRLRMSSVYYLAALYSALKGGTYVVAGTSNKCELYTGYFTKGGDNTFDIGVIGNYTVSEVIKIGEYIGVPECALYKTPSDGLSGMSDEDKLGVKYADIEKHLNHEPLDEEVEQRIIRLHNNAQHKFNIPMYTRE